VGSKFRKILAVSLLSFTLLVTSCGGDFNVFGAKTAEVNKTVLLQPLTLVMPTTNYNQRPENTKIDTIIIHHTAPFASLTRVGYFFQDINSRVSSHYIVGKEGLIIECVDEKDRAWHAGYSSWRGKMGVNDYSVGIEVLNDGDSKDPFTEPQYNSLARLTAYLMKKYDVPVSRVIGHRDIALPMGRKIDPADNFNWKLFKGKIRTILNQPQSFFGWGDLPQESNMDINEIKRYLNSTIVAERSFALDNLLTVNFKQATNYLENAFNKETNSVVKAKFFKLFEIYEDKNYINAALKIFDNYKTEPAALTSAVVTYLYAVDKDNSKEKFFNTFADQDLPDELKYTLIRVLTNYKDELIESAIVDRLTKTISKPEKKVIIESLAKYENKEFNNILSGYLDDSVPADLKSMVIDTLRVTFDQNIEKKLIDMLKNDPLPNSVLESITWTLLRKDSVKGIKALQEEKVYKQLSPKLQIGIFNTLGRLKMTDSEDWLIKQADKPNSEYVEASAYLALGKMETDKSFNYLYKSLKDNISLNFILFKALSNYNKPEIRKAIAQVLQGDKLPIEVKMLAISAVKERKISELLPLLKSMYAENRDPDIDMVIEDAIQSFEPKEVSSEK
jgi:N-acetyl-anhydromuramyl-L-alanine amidase AmpD/HEAT repeat protein